MICRRTFLRSGSMLAAGLAARNGFAADHTERDSRKFKISLRCFSIGVDAGQREAIRLAAKHGFEAVNADSRFLAGLNDDELQALLGDLRSAGIVWGSASLPVEFRKDEATFKEDLSMLPKRAAALKRAGVSRVGTYIIPSHDELTYTQNMKQHADRLKRCAKVLGDHGHRFGLEYVGPQTSLVGKRFPFLHTMAETFDLIDAIGQENVGLLLDSWHWYTAGETVDDLLNLSNEQVVACDLNDAPAGLDRTAQIDNQRELPTATGVIDLKGFLSALIKIGYDGPVRAEPFNRDLNQLDKDAACAATAKAMKKAVGLVEGGR